MSARTEVPGELAPLLTFLTERTGLALRGHRPADLRALVHRAMEVSDTPDLSSFVALLERAPARLDALVDDLTIGETHFFREPGHLELLTGRILPELLQRRSVGHRLQLWSAGCASGEEPYTLAILLEEAGLAGTADVLGTDISRAALRLAQEATYRTWSLRGVDGIRLQRYFQPHGDRSRLVERVTRRVELRQLNLLTDTYPAAGGGGFDVIFCRNVLIYLTPQAIDRVVRQLVDALADGGWLVTASSDPHLGSADRLETIVTREGVAYRRPGATATGRAPRTARSERRPRRTARTSIERRVADSSTAAAPAADRPRTVRVRPELTGLARARALADAGELDQALALIDRLSDVASTDPGAQHLRAVLLLAARRWPEAAAAAAAALYLDPDMAVTEVVRGRAQLALGNGAAAGRAFRNARRLLEGRPADEQVRFADGASAGRLLAELDRLDHVATAGTQP